MGVALRETGEVHSFVDGRGRAGKHQMLKTKQHQQFHEEVSLKGGKQHKFTHTTPISAENTYLISIAPERRVKSSGESESNVL